ncbi:MAG TPA: glycoside hydrolase family 97 C-terminal domain-containing protein, partial [Bacteroidota bacterium]
VLNGMPGDYITIVRRSGSNWFLGSMTDWSPRDTEVKLEFLGDGKYTAEIYRDAGDSGTHPTSVVMERKTVDRTSTLVMSLASAGGYAVRFVREAK